MLFDVYRVLLPDWALEDDKRANQYLQRYPHYYLDRIEDGFAICKFRL